MILPSSALAVLGLAALANAHMKITNPAPYGASDLDNSPLSADGSDYPCKQRANVYGSATATNTMPLGSVQTVAFMGSAVHGGGSCQFSVTYDEKPTAKSTFKVIHSVEGGCPMKNIAGNNGNDATEIDPDTYSFTLPDTLPTGKATFAWSWNNKIGNREMYMNCAPIVITAAASKRDAEEEDLMARNVTQLMQRDQAAYDALPDIFVANIGPGCSGTGACDLCQVLETFDVVYPNPGDSVDKFGGSTSTATHTPVGPSCGVNYLAAAAGGTVATATAGGSVPSVSAAAIPTSTQAATQSSAAVVPTNTGAPSGGVFITTPSAGGGSQATSASVAAPSSTSAASEASSAAATQPASSAAASAPAPASTGTTGSGSAETGACTTEGMWNCIGGDSFQQCASGSWSVVQSVAAGTTCTPGQSMAITITKKKRSLRFPRRNISS